MYIEEYTYTPFLSQAEPRLPGPCVDAVVLGQDTWIGQARIKISLFQRFCDMYVHLLTLDAETQNETHE